MGPRQPFSVYLPLVEADHVLPSAPASEAPHGEGRRVLVVDDNQDSAESLAALLKMWGHEVETAADGIEACEVAERFRPDVVLLDLRMPRLDGYGAPGGSVALRGAGIRRSRRRDGPGVGPAPVGRGRLRLTPHQARGPTRYAGSCGVRESA